MARAARTGMMAVSSTTAALAFDQAIAHLTGTTAPRDVPAARALLQQAADMGHHDGAMLAASLLANGSGGPIDWSGATRLLKSIAAQDERAAVQLDMLAAMALDEDGGPTSPITRERLGSQPDVWRITTLLSQAECVHVAATAIDLLTPATVVDPATGRNISNPIRTSDGAVIGPVRESLVIQAINRRIAAATGTDWRQGEALTVLRYAPGQEFRPHLDAIAGAGNQRIMTMLVYLNDDFTGGATHFLSNGLRVSPKTGDAIIFSNVTQDGAIDRAAQHAGEPVTRGHKWLATRWIRARPFSPWTGPDVALR